ncbi:MAG: flagellar biosynthesis protein FliQ [Spirochaetaceae bacterium]|jgi:flagellar biosynthetic protein FliQ|nr:flagellar biosynthesis protein FliQ [Spirochaetaceae bacterium]
MTIGDMVTLLRGGIFQVLIISAPLLISALVVGLVIAILQAATQIQEQTLTFVPKILVILLILALLGGWMFTTLANYTEELFRMIPSMAA